MQVLAKRGEDVIAAASARKLPWIMLSRVAERGRAPLGRVAQKSGRDSAIGRGDTACWSWCREPALDATQHGYRPQDRGLGAGRTTDARCSAPFSPRGSDQKKVKGGEKLPIMPAVRGGRKAPRLPGGRPGSASCDRTKLTKIAPFDCRIRVASINALVTVWNNCGSV